MSEKHKPKPAVTKKSTIGIAIATLVAIVVAIWVAWDVFKLAVPAFFANIATAVVIVWAAVFFNSKLGWDIRYFFYDYAHCWLRRCYKCNKRIFGRVSIHTPPASNEPFPFHAKCHSEQKLPGWIRKWKEQEKEAMRIGEWHEKGAIMARKRDERDDDANHHPHKNEG